MTFREIAKRLSTLLGLYKTIKCKYDDLYSKFFDPDGNPWEDDTPANADLNVNIPNGSYVVMDGTNGSFPRGQVWYKY